MSLINTLQFARDANRLAKTLQSTLELLPKHTTSVHSQGLCNDTELYLAVQLSSCYSLPKFAGVKLVLCKSKLHVCMRVLNPLNLFCLGEGAWARGNVTPVVNFGRMSMVAKVQLYLGVQLKCFRTRS